MRLGVGISVTVVVLLTIAMLTLSGWSRPPVDTIQRGFRGLGMELVYNPRTVAQELEANQVPPSSKPMPATGPTAGQVYKNVQVLGDVSVVEFARLMASITQWVAPKQGCAYCHGADGNFADDTLYTKVVARRMLQMTRHINSDWHSHVAATGVTCYTCHRGQPVPEAIWFKSPEQEKGMAGNRAGQNAPAPSVGLTSLPNDPFSRFLDTDQDLIRVVATQALPGTDRHSVKQAESTYGLMMHMSESLGVNCTFCHNTRSFTSWDQSTPQRATAWYGIKMVNDLNRNFLVPLGPEFPSARLGPLGDPPKLNCATCHRGVYKPLFGVSMLTHYPELAGTPAPAAPAQ